MSEDADGDESDHAGGYYETNEKGRIVEQYSDADFLDALDALGAASTGDVADRLGCSPRRTRDRLKQLASDGRIEKQDTKGGYVWLPVENE